MRLATSQGGKSGPRRSSKDGTNWELRLNTGMLTSLERGVRRDMCGSDVGWNFPYCKSQKQYRSEVT